MKESYKATTKAHTKAPDTQNVFPFYPYRNLTVIPTNPNLTLIFKPLSSPFILAVTLPSFCACFMPEVSLDPHLSHPPK